MALDKTTPLADPRFVLRQEFSNAALIFDPDTGEQYHFNGAGARVWRWLNGRRRPADIVKRLRAAYSDVPQQAERQVSDFVQMLMDKGLIFPSRRPADANGEDDPQEALGDAVDFPWMRTPRTVDVAVTARCNLHCTYCSHFSSAGDVDADLSTAEWLTFFRQLQRAAVMRVTLQGGEPFCRADLRALIEGIVANRMRFAILSNGTRVSREMAAFLAATGRCDGVQVSLDGSGAAVHDKFRGRGSFDAALEGLRRLQQAGLPVSVRVTLHRNNIADLPAIARLLLEDCDLDDFSCNAASHLGLCRENSCAVQLTAAERTRAMAVLTELAQNYPGRIQATAGPLAEAACWQDMIQARRQDRNPPPGGGRLTGCGGPMQTLAVRADGMLVPCIQLSHLELGRINRDDLVGVWQRHPILQRLRRRGDMSLDSFAFCQGCDFLAYCTGNCPALAYTLTGDDHHPSPDACLRRFLEQGGRLPERGDFR